MSNDKNKTQLISLLLNQWTIDNYATRLVDRNLYYVIGEEVLGLTCEDDKSVSKYPEENLFSSQEGADTRIILHCLNIRTSLPDASTIIVRSPDTDVIVLLARYCKDIHFTVLFDTGVGNKRRLLNVNNIVQNTGEEICTVLPAIHCFTGCDTTSVRCGKVAPIKLIETPTQFIQILSRIGQEINCSEALISNMEALTCAIYGGATYTNVNVAVRHVSENVSNPGSILRKSISGRYRPVRVADGPMTARCRFT